MSQTEEKKYPVTCDKEQIFEFPEYENIEITQIVWNSNADNLKREENASIPPNNNQTPQ